MGREQFASDCIIHHPVSRFPDIAENRSKSRVCERFAHMCGPGESLCRSELAESGETYPGAILLGPRTIALDSRQRFTR